MFVERIREVVEENKKLLVDSFEIENNFPRIFVFGKHSAARLRITLHKKNFKKFLDKLEFEALPIRFEVEYIGYGLLGYVEQVEGRKPKWKYVFFGARNAKLYTSEYKEYGPGDSVSIDYIAIPYLTLPSISINLEAKKVFEENKIYKLFVIHEYHLNIYTQAKGEEIRLIRYSWYPLVAYPPFKLEEKSYSMELIRYIKSYFREDSENYYHEFRGDKAIVEMGAIDIPIKMVIVAPYYHNFSIGKGVSEKKMVESGFMNIRRITKFEDSKNILNLLEKAKFGFSTRSFIEKEITIYLGLTGGEKEKYKGDKFELIIASGKAILTNGSLMTKTIDWVKREKFSGKKLLKRQKIKTKIRIPLLGSSIFYKPDNVDLKAIYKIITDREIEIYSLSQFDELERELVDKKVIIENFRAGIRVFPYIEVQLTRNGKKILEQTIPIILSIKLEGE